MAEGRINAPKEGITLRMFVNPKAQNLNGDPDLSARDLKKDEARTGDKKFFVKDVKMNNFSLSSFKRQYAV
jgi:hypothetical protein